MAAGARRGTDVDLVEQRGTEEVGAGGRRHKAAVGGIEGALIVHLGVIDGNLRPSADVDVVVEVSVAP